MKKFKLTAFLSLMFLASCGKTSLYEEAKKQGFNGSEEEFNQAITDSKKSAFDLAKEQGFNGNEDLFNELINNQVDSFKIATNNGFTGSLEDWNEVLGTTFHGDIVNTYQTDECDEFGRNITYINQQYKDGHVEKYQVDRPIVATNITLLSNECVVNTLSRINVEITALVEGQEVTFTKILKKDMIKGDFDITKPGDYNVEITAYGKTINETIKVVENQIEYFNVLVNKAPCYYMKDSKPVFVGDLIGAIEVDYLDGSSVEKYLSNDMIQYDLTENKFYVEYDGSKEEIYPTLINEPTENHKVTNLTINETSDVHCYIKEVNEITYKDKLYYEYIVSDGVNQFTCYKYVNVTDGDFTNISKDNLDVTFTAPSIDFSLADGVSNKIPYTMNLAVSFDTCNNYVFVDPKTNKAYIDLYVVKQNYYNTYYTYELTESNLVSGDFKTSGIKEFEIFGEKYMITLIYQSNPLVIEYSHATIINRNYALVNVYYSGVLEETVVVKYTDFKNTKLDKYEDELGIFEYEGKDIPCRIIYADELGKYVQYFSSSIYELVSGSYKNYAYLDESLTCNVNEDYISQFNDKYLKVYLDDGSTSKSEYVKFEIKSDNNSSDSAIFDLSKVDFTKPGSYEVSLSYRNYRETYEFTVLPNTESFTLKETITISIDGMTQQMTIYNETLDGFNYADVMGDLGLIKISNNQLIVRSGGYMMPINYEKTESGIYILSIDNYGPTDNKIKGVKELETIYLGMYGNFQRATLYENGYIEFLEGDNSYSYGEYKLVDDKLILNYYGKIVTFYKLNKIGDNYSYITIEEI